MKWSPECLSGLTIKQGLAALDANFLCGNKTVPVALLGDLEIDMGKVFKG